MFTFVLSQSQRFQNHRNVALPDMAAATSHFNHTEKLVHIEKQDPREIVIKLLITDYVEFYKKNRFHGKKLIVRFEGDHPGLGDRMSTILNSYLIAALTRRVLVVDWLHPFRINEIFQIRLPNLLFQYPQDHDRFAYHCRSQCRPLDLRPFLGNRQTVYVYTTPLASALVLRHMVTEFRRDPLIHKVFEKLLVMEPRFHIYKEAFRVLFWPTSNVQSYLNPISPMTIKPYLAIHARLGKGVGEVGGPRFLSSSHVSIERWCNCFVHFAVNKIISTNTSNLQQIYLATDTTEFRKCFETRFENALSHVQQVKVAQPGLLPIHTKRCITPINEACQFTIAEFTLLSNAELMIASTSSFSRVASLIGNVRNVEIVNRKHCEKFL